VVAGAASSVLYSLLSVLCFWHFLFFILWDIRQVKGHSEGSGIAWLLRQRVKGVSLMEIYYKFAVFLYASPFTFHLIKACKLSCDSQFVSYWRVKVKFSRYRPGVAQRVVRCIALLLHDRGTGRGWVVSSTPRPHFTPGKDPVLIL